MLGRVTDINYAKTAVLSEGSGYAPALPLANMLDDSRPVTAPARCLTPADLASAKFKITFPGTKAVSIIALLFHSFSIDATYRITVAGADGDLNNPAYQTDWTAIHPAVYEPEDMEFEDDNWWSGQLSEADIALYRGHKFVTFPLTTTSAIRVEINDATNPAGYFDIGWLWVGRTWSTTYNFERGRGLSVRSRDVKDEGPSGREFSEKRRGRRVLTVDYTRLTDDEVYRWIDSAARCGSVEPVLFLPDADDPKSLLREAFPATYATPPAARFTYARLGQAGMTLQEIIA